MSSLSNDKETLTTTPDRFFNHIMIFIIINVGHMKIFLNM